MNGSPAGAETHQLGHHLIVLRRRRAIDPSGHRVLHATIMFNLYIGLQSVLQLEEEAMQPGQRLLSD
jgi:hypothetical protein